MILLIISLILQIIAYIPYLRDILKRKTEPHAYTWLIWAITQGIAAAGIYYGFGGLAIFQLIFGVITVLIVFAFSFKYGTKNITKSDKIVFILALLSIVVWWKLKQPLISILMVTLIDLFGFYPTLRKTYQEPWSETLSTWIFFTLSNLLAIFCISKYSLLTSTYLIAITFLDFLLVLVIFYRKKIVFKNTNK